MPERSGNDHEIPASESGCSGAALAAPEGLDPAVARVSDHAGYRRLRERGFGWAFRAVALEDGDGGHLGGENRSGDIDGLQCDRRAKSGRRRATGSANTARLLLGMAELGSAAGSCRNKVLLAGQGLCLVAFRTRPACFVAMMLGASLQANECVPVLVTMVGAAMVHRHCRNSLRGKREHQRPDHQRSSNREHFCAASRNLL